MKKLLPLLMLVLFGASSCSKDEAINNSQLAAEGATFGGLFTANQISPDTAQKAAAAIQDLIDNDLSGWTDGSKLIVPQELIDFVVPLIQKKIASISPTVAAMLKGIFDGALAMPALQLPTGSKYFNPTQLGFIKGFLDAIDSGDKLFLDASAATTSKGTIPPDARRAKMFCFRDIHKLYAR